VTEDVSANCGNGHAAASIVPPTSYLPAESGRPIPHGIPSSGGPAGHVHIEFHEEKRGRLPQRLPRLDPARSRWGRRRHRPRGGGLAHGRGGHAVAGGQRRAGARGPGPRSCSSGSSPSRTASRTTSAATRSDRYGNSVCRPACATHPQAILIGRRASAAVVASA
jgi:hypothetical protein